MESIRASIRAKVSAHPGKKIHPGKMEFEGIRASGQNFPSAQFAGIRAKNPSGQAVTSTANPHRDRPLNFHPGKQLHPRRCTHMHRSARMEKSGTATRPSAHPGKLSIRAGDGPSGIGCFPPASGSCDRTQPAEWLSYDSMTSLSHHRSKLSQFDGRCQ